MGTSAYYAPASSAIAMAEIAALEMHGTIHAASDSGPVIEVHEVTDPSLLAALREA